jgi:hypothetical protein
MADTHNSGTQVNTINARTAQQIYPALLSSLSSMGGVSLVR